MYGGIDIYLKKMSFILTHTQNKYKVGTLYKTLNAGNGETKYFLKTVAFNNFQTLILLSKSDWSINCRIP